MKPCKKCGVSFKIIWITVSILLIAPAIGSDYFNDDYFFDNELFAQESPFGYYDFLENKDAKIVPWWAHEEFRIRFFRPLASLTLHLDFTIAPNTPIAAHLHSLLWLIILLLGAFKLFEHLLSDSAKPWAVVLFSIGLFHAWAAGWIAARHAIMSGAILSWAAWIFLQWTHNQKSKFELSYLALFGFALLTSEASIALVAFVGGWAIINGKSNLERIRLFLPILTLGIAYLIFYHTMGFGVRASGLYTDPIDNPFQFILSLPEKMLALLASFTFGIPATLRIIPLTKAIPTAAGIFSLILWIAALLLARKNMEKAQKLNLRWMLPSIFLCMLPEMAGLVEGRGSLLSSILFAAVAAEIMVAVFCQSKLAGRIATYATGGVLVLGLLLTSPVSRIGAGFFIFQGSKSLKEGVKNSEIICPHMADFFVINADPMTSVLWPYLVAKQRGVIFSKWNQLAMVSGPLKLTRTDKDTIVLSNDTGVVDSFLKVYRPADAPFESDAVIEKENMRVRILETKEGMPTLIEYKFGRGMKNSCFLTAQKNYLKTIEMPEIGKSTTIEWVSPM